MKAKSFIAVLFFLYLFTSASKINGALSDTGWKAGTAKVKITPAENLWLAGYAARTRPSEGKLHDLWAKALFLEDTDGNNALLITTDLVGVSKEFSDRIRNKLNDLWGLSRSQIILNSSHTHSGPVLTNILTNIYPLDDQEKEKIQRYSEWLEEQLITLAEKAIKSLKPVNLYAGNGVVRFQVNRRNNPESKIGKINDLNGPNDYAVPVLKIENKKSGKTKAIVFGYACHPTVLDGYLWSGDYPGFAQLQLEKDYKGALAMFFQGAGADQNPLPRRSVPLARQYGKELAAAVARVLEEKMRPLSTGLKTIYSEINLEFNNPLSKKQLIRFRDENSGYQKRWAEDMLKQIERGIPFEKNYPYPVQLWQIGEQTIVSLGGELLVSYAIALKKALGNDIFVMGYSNDVMTYIPGEKVLAEGGYEGETAHVVFGHPSTWKAGIEQKIIDEVISLERKMNSNP